LFYKAAYKVVFAYNTDSSVADTFPLQHFLKTPLMWVNDLVAPFFQFIKVDYAAQTTISTDRVLIQSRQIRWLFGKPRQLAETTVYIGQDGIHDFMFDTSNIKLEAKWDIRNTY